MAVPERRSRMSWRDERAVWAWRLRARSNCASNGARRTGQHTYILPFDHHLLQLTFPYYPFVPSSLRPLLPHLPLSAMEAMLRVSETLKSFRVRAAHCPVAARGLKTHVMRRKLA